MNISPSISFHILALYYILQYSTTGIQKYMLCIGSHSGFCDKMAYTEHVSTATEVNMPHDLDGHHYYITVQVEVFAFIDQSFTVWKCRETHGRVSCPRKFVAIEGVALCKQIILRRFERVAFDL